MRYCYGSELPLNLEGACTNQARYEAKLDWTEGPMLLCEEHAILERSWDAVIEIHSLARQS